MPSTHTSLHYHLVFSTKDRKPIIAPEWRAELHAYLGGIVKGLDAHPEGVGGVADHVHLLVSLKPVICLSDFMRELKKSSSIWAGETQRPGFQWQEGYAAFTVSPSARDSVRRYIAGQEEHHRVRSFREELVACWKNPAWPTIPGISTEPGRTAVIPPGCNAGEPHSFRWCRSFLARPPATTFHPSGMGFRTLEELGDWQGIDPKTGFQLVKTAQGTVLKIADFVDDDPAKRDRVSAALKDPESAMWGSMPNRAAFNWRSKGWWSRRPRRPDASAGRT